MALGRLKQTITTPKRWQLLAVCALLGAASFFILFGVRTLDVTNESWIWPSVPEADVVQHYAGWLAYRNSPWQFPLAYTDALLWPDGTLVAYTDSNPLLCILFKLLSPLLPATFQFFGWFVLACFVLQGVAAGLLLSLFLPRGWQVWAGTLVFTFAPILIERSFRHSQLAAHFLVLFALYLYLAMRRGGYAKAPWQFILLNALAMAIHPYFMPMVMSVLAVALVEYAVKTRRVLRALGSLGLNLLAALGVGALLGTIGWGGAELSRGGYGLFSMNLNALFNPAGVGEYTWSLVLGRHPVIEGQQDGFNYLGLGVLLLLAVCGLHWLAQRAAKPQPARQCAKDALRFVRHRAPLLVMCLFLTLFAVSHIVVLHNSVLLTLPLPQALVRLGGIFRAGSRMFWPVYYLLYLFVFRYLARHFQPRVTSLLVGVLVAVQLMDLTGVVREKHHYFNNPPAVQTVMQDETLAALATGYTRLLAVENLAQELFYHHMAFAARHGLVTNLGVVNTGQYPGAVQAGQNAAQALLAGEADPGTIYIAKTPALVAQIRQALQGQAVDYYEFGDYTYIFPRAG